MTEATGARDGVTVSAPVPPDDADAWYAPAVRAQREVHPGVVVTVREDGAGYRYDVREPAPAAAAEGTLSRVRDHFADANRSRPRTREGVRSRMAAGFAGKYERAIERLLADVDSRASGRRVRYRALRDLRCLGPVTPLALDGAVEVAEAGDERVRVHTERFAPARTALPGDVDHLDRVLSERLRRYTVPFREFDVPVVVFRERVLGPDAFDVKYAVLEPDLLPGDGDLIAACKDRLWAENVDGVVEDRAAFVRERARQFLARQLTARNAGAWLEATAHRVRRALSAYGVGVPPVGERYSTERLDDLVYYVMRDFVGDDKLTVPIRDEHLEDVEANRVGERIKVVPRPHVHDGRVPTNLVFEDETRFTNVVTQLAAGGGVELNASRPSAKVNLDPAEVADDLTIRCAVALPVVSEDGPHVSIRKQAPEAMTPADLVERNSVSSGLVALLWLAYEHRRVVLFSGPTGVGKTTLMNAHMPFIPYDDRPISIDEGSREVRLPQETGVSLTTREHENEYKRVSMADLMAETNYLNPDVEVIAEINTPESFATFGEVLNTGHGVVGTTHAEDVETLVNRTIEQGLPAHLLRELDLVVFPMHVDDERYVGEVVEFVDPETADGLPGAGGRTAKGGEEIAWNRVAHRDHEGEFHLAGDGGADAIRFFDAVARATDRPVAEVEAEFERKRRYVEYMVREGMTEFDDVFGFLSDLRNEEAATVEGLQ